MATGLRRPHGFVRGDLIEVIYCVDRRLPQGTNTGRAGYHAKTISGAAPSSDRGDILRKAEDYRSRGRVRKAVREYEKILAADPRDVEVHAKVAPLYIRIGRKDKAKASLRLVIAGYEKQGFADKAIAMLRLALKLDRRDLRARLHLADLYLAKDQAGNALRLLERARGLYRGKRFLKEALTVEGKILIIAPDDFRAQVAIVRLLSKAGRGDEGRDRLVRMESEWARKGNRKNWRKTRWLLARHAPSAATLCGYLVALFKSPVAYRHARAGRLAW